MNIFLLKSANADLDDGLGKYSGLRSTTMGY